MTAVVIVGAQWGDEGKGKIVDVYTESADVVVRYAGGPNAGHTLVVGDEKLVVRLLPSGILREGTRSVLGQGMVIDPAVLVGEIDALIARGHKDVASRLLVSDRAHVILPYHLAIDGARENAAKAGRALGTTKKGIGPAYEDKARRTGVRTGELRNPARLLSGIEAALEAWAPTLRELGGTIPKAQSIVDELRPLADRIVPLLGDASRAADDALRANKKVMFEGAQGTLLDIDHGTYPFVTSSSAGAPIGPSRIDTVIGITKAYTTRVGAGPFPTELDDDHGKHLRERGAEFGSVTGRPRRTGWLDLPALRYAVRVNGLDGFALTKLDVLTGLDRVKVCVAYETPDGRSDDFPIDSIDEPGRVHPVYEEFAGWNEPLGAARALGDLPASAQRYVRFIEEKTETPLYLVSVGASRRDSIVLRDPFALT